MEHENAYEENAIQQTQPKKDYLLPISILIAGVLISGSVIYSVGKKSGGVAEQLPSKQVAGAALTAASQSDLPPISNQDTILGDPKAPVSLIEYGDYQCPFCGRFFNQVEPSLREDYIKTGKVKMVFRNFQFLGPESIAAAYAAYCARDQHQFWGFHDALYTAETQDGHENNGNLNLDLFIKLAQNLKLDAGAFTSCLDSNKYADLVKKDTESAQLIGVNSTPTTFVNGQKLQGALPYDQFKSAIEAALKGK